MKHKCQIYMSKDIEEKQNFQGNQGPQFCRVKWCLTSHGNYGKNPKNSDTLKKCCKYL